jgi:hypothetical protein
LDKTLFVGSLEDTGGIIKREDGAIYVSGVLQREGVFNSGLKLYEEFEESIPSMVGIDLLRGEHPIDDQGNFRPHNDKDDIIGVIIDAIKDPENKLAKGIFKLDESKLTADEIKQLEDGKGIGTSPGYWCDKVPLPEPKLWEDGTPYSFIEKKQFRYDSFATPKNPACKKCGMLINSNTGGDSIPKQRKPEEIKEASDKLKMEGEPTFMVNQALDELMLQSEILDVLECGDDYQSGVKARKLLVQILKTILGTPETSPLMAMSQHKPKEIEMKEEDVKLMVNAAIEKASKHLKDELVQATKTNEAQKKTITDLTVNAKMTPEEASLKEKIKLMVNEEVAPVKEALSTAEKTITAQATEITTLKTAEQTRIDEAKKATETATAAAEESNKKDFFAHLKPGIAKTDEEKKTLWETIKSNVGGWIFANPDKMALTGNSELPKYTPKGLPIVPALQANSAEERDQKYREMGITPASELTKMWDKKVV